MLGALITGGLSLIGGLFGRSDAKKAAKREEQAIAAANAANAKAAAEAAKKPIITEGTVDMKGFLKAAEEGGFNKVSFLRSGALGLFGRSMVWNAGGGAAAAPVMPVVSGVKIPGIGSIVADAAGAGYNAWQTEQNEQRRMNFQREMLGMQLAGQPNNGYRGGGYGVARDPGFRGFDPPSMKTSGSNIRTGSSILSGSLLGAGGSYQAQKFKNPGDPLAAFGWPVATASDTSNTEDAETRYGDGPVSWIWGAGVAVRDLYHTGKQYYGEYQDKYVVEPYNNNQVKTSTPGVSAIGTWYDDASAYVDRISASPENKGKTWGQLAQDWGLSW